MSKEESNKLKDPEIIKKTNELIKSKAKELVNKANIDENVKKSILENIDKNLTIKNHKTTFSSILDKHLPHE